jgi:hypothetical protein
MSSARTANSSLRNANAVWTTSSVFAAVDLATWPMTVLAPPLSPSPKDAPPSLLPLLLLLPPRRHREKLKIPSLSESCGNDDGEVKEVRLNAAALSDPNSLHTQISFPSFPSSHCFVDPLFLAKNSIPSYDIPPVILRLIDGTIGATIMSAADISIRFSTNDILHLKFCVTKLDPTSAFVFGHNWLHR